MDPYHCAFAGFAKVAVTRICALSWCSERSAPGRCERFRTASRTAR